MTSLRRLDGFLVALLATVGVATLLPVRGAGASVLTVLTQVAVGLLFFLYGGRLPAREAWSGLRNWRLHLTVLASTFVLFPALGYACKALSPTVLTPSLAAGVLFLCLLPSTVQTSIAFTSLAGGNVAAAICGASLSNVVGVVATPLLTGWLLAAGGGVSGGAILRIAGELLVPFLLGQAARPWIGGLLAGHPQGLSRYDRGTVLFVVYAAFSEGVTAGVWHQVTVPRLLAVLAVDAALLGLVLTLTFRVSRGLGFPVADRIVVVMCGSKKSIAAGIPMATALFAHSEVSLIVLPAMLYHQLQLMVCAIIARRLGRRDDEPPAAVTAPRADGAVAGMGRRQPVDSARRA